MKKTNNQGFSLVELIIVIAIMAVLVGVLAPQFIKYVEKTRAQKDASAVEELRNAVEIALSEQTIYDQVVTATTSAAVNITANTAGVLSFPTSISALQTEITSTVGTSLNFTSKAYKAKGATVTITYNSTTQNFVVTAFITP
jgi:type IV pilus assembly protein PilA